MGTTSVTIATGAEDETQPYPAIADYGILGDCRSAALVTRFIGRTGTAVLTDLLSVRDAGYSSFIPDHEISYPIHITKKNIRKPARAA